MDKIFEKRIKEDEVESWVKPEYLRALEIRKRKARINKSTIDGIKENQILLRRTNPDPRDSTEYSDLQESGYHE